MLSKFLFTINYLIFQSDASLEAKKQVHEQFKQQQEALELSRLTTILSIALITILVLLVFSLVRSNQLRNEIKRLKSLNS